MTGKKSIRLRLDQLELIVMMAERVFDLSAPDPKSRQTADIIGRRVLRRRCRELVADITRVYPDAGKPPQ